MPPPLLPALLARIAALQSAGDPLYPAGVFPSERGQAALGYRRPDANGFFTSSIALVLRDLERRLPVGARATVQASIGRAVAAYPLFESAAGVPLYNFYQTRPSRHFPHGYLLRRGRKFATPDDADCTALVYLTDPRPPAQAQWLHQHLQAYANTAHGRAVRWPAAFRHRPVYGAWFGYRMPLDLDTSTVANVLLWVTRAGLPLNDYDQASLDFVDWAITSGTYQRAPLAVSAYYGTAPLVAYHVGRLAAEVPVLAGVRAALLRDLPPLLARPGRCSFPEKILLATTLLRLGATPLPLLAPTTPLAEVEALSRGFVYFRASLLHYHPPLRWLAGWPPTQLHWQCPAHALALVAEYLMLAGQ